MTEQTSQVQSRAKEVTAEQAVKMYAGSGVPDARARQIVAGVIERGGRGMFQAVPFVIVEPAGGEAEESQEARVEGVEPPTASGESQDAGNRVNEPPTADQGHA